jgi:hypothetical protein
MTEGWLILISGKRRPNGGFQLSKNQKSWWRIAKSRDEAIRIKREILVPGNFDWKCIKIQLSSPTPIKTRHAKSWDSPKITARPKCSSNFRRRGRGRRGM